MSAPPIEIREDRFDAELLGQRVVKIWLHDPPDARGELERVLSLHRPDVACCFAAFSAENIAALQALGFKLVSIRSTYEAKLGASPDAPRLPPPAEGFALKRASGGVPAVEADDLTELAEVIGETSRYFKDKEIPAASGRAVYVRWLENSLFHGYADDAVLLMRGPRLVGVSTLKIKGDVGSIDLIGVAGSAQGSGLGALLLLESLTIFRERGLRAAAVVTEAENVGASRFYQRHGFLLQATELVWHRHGSEPS